MVKKRCFVIMPFSKTKEHHTEEYWTRHFNSYLKPLIEKSGELEAFRSEPLRGNIANQIITDLVSSDVVVSDLTDHNPNVLWELGVRQSFKHCNITIAEAGTQIPFHFSHKGILFYNGEHLDNQFFETKFFDALKNCLTCPNEPDSPVLEAMGGRGTLYSIIHKDENNRKIQALQDEIAYNEALFKKVMKNCEENDVIRADKSKGECSLISVFLTCSATEFLYINRYLDLNKNFYDFLLPSYYFSMVAINRRLEAWVTNSDEVEIWLKEIKDNFLSTTSDLKKQLSDYQ